MDQGTHLVTDVERGNPPGHRLLAVCHGHDLLPLQCEQQELLALECRLTGELDGPPVQLTLDVAQQLPFQ